MCNIENIKTTSSKNAGNKNRGTTSVESLQGLFILMLGVVTINRSCREIVGYQEVTEHVSHVLDIDKDKCQAKVFRLAC